MRRIAVLAGAIGLLATSLARADAPRNPDAVAVIIGNEKYADPDVPKVEFASRDAAAIRRYVIDVLGYDERNVFMVQDATQGDLNSWFGTADNPHGQLADAVREGESDVFVYYSGHGVPGPKDEAYLLPADAHPATIALNGYKLSQLKTNLQGIEARSVTVLLDACFSGASGDGGTLIRDASVLTRPASPVPGELGALTWIAASGADQVANWDKADRHGLFTEYFLRAVYGAADSAKYGGHGDGKITLGAVQAYLDKEMSYAARREYHRPQKASLAGDAATVLAQLDEKHPPARADDAPAAKQVMPAPAKPAQVAVAEPRVPPAAGVPADEANARGMAAYKAKHYDEALRWFRQAAEQDNTAACLNLGSLYQDGLGVARDYAEAMRWFRRAADKGQPTAMNQIGYLYQHGLGVAVDYGEAMRWYRLAANKGEPSGVNNIGFMYHNGLGVPQDYAEAMRWYRQAADKGHAESMLNVAALYAKGLGVPKDCNAARSWLEKAAALGSKGAKAALDSNNECVWR